MFDWRDLWLAFRRPATCIRFCSMVSETASTYVSRNGSFFAQEKWKIWLTRRMALNTLSLAHPPAFDLAVRWPSLRSFICQCYDHFLYIRYVLFS